MNTESQFKILLIEDNSADADLITELFSQTKSGTSIFALSTGEAALNFFRKTDAFADIGIPDLILLDLNMPRIDGKVVLREIKSNPSLQAIPVFVLSTSTREDAHHSFGDAIEQADRYFVKPMSLSQFREIVKSIEEFLIAAREKKRALENL